METGAEVLFTADGYNTTETTPTDIDSRLSCTLFQIFLGISFGVNVLLVLVALYLYFRRIVRPTRAPPGELPHPNSTNPPGDDDVERGVTSDGSANNSGGVRQRVVSVFPKDDGYLTPVDILRLLDAFKSFSQTRSVTDPDQDYLITTEDSIERHIYEEVWQEATLAGSFQMRSAVDKVLSTTAIEPIDTEDLTEEMMEKRLLAMEGIVWETPLTNSGTTDSGTESEMAVDTDRCTPVIAGDLTRVPRDEIPDGNKDPQKSSAEIDPKNIAPDDTATEPDVRLTVSRCSDDGDVLSPGLSPIDMDRVHTTSDKAEADYRRAENTDLLQQQVIGNPRVSIIVRDDNGSEPDGETTL